MVQFTGATLLALAGVVAAGAHRVPAHAALHRRGGGGEYSLSSPAAASQTWTMSSYPATSPAADTTCTDEESTTPAGSTSTYVASTPAAASSYPASSPAGQPSYPASSPPAASTYPASSPAGQPSYPASSPSAASTYPASTPEEQSTYPASTPAAASTYPASTPVAESSYPASSPVAESSYPASSPVAESSYPASSPNSYKSTSTSTYYMTSTAVYTVTGGSSPGESSPAAGSGAPQGGCGTVTVTVTAGQAPPAPHHHKSKPAQSTYEASSPQAAPTYPASSYQATTPQAAETYAASSPANSYPTTTPAANGAPVGGKRGVAYASVSTLDFGQASNIQYVPILKDESMASDFQEAAKSASYVMGMNEVDMTTGGGGSAMTPSEAASLWQQYIQPLAGKVKLGSPSVTSDNSPNSNLNGVSAASGTDYLQQFAEACQGCTIDFACAHWYGQNGASGSDQAQQFISYMEDYIKTVQGLWGEGTKVWVTEFSALPEINQDTSGVNEEFMSTVLPWLEQNDSVDRYSYYAAIPELLVNADGTLTRIGQTYASS
jgi:Glycosyl hydrolase catalytic core